MQTETAKKFKYWQTRTIVATMIGYALFYFVRKNLSVAMPGMQDDLGISKTDLGIFLTLHGLVYGVSRFANGYIGDKVDPRKFMVIGLVLAAICNLIFGFSSAVLVFGILWVLNGWIQGMGFPPCVKLLTHWIPPQQLATKMSIWNTSHSIGAGAVVIICGFVVHWGWRWCFYIPSLIALLGAVYLWFALRGTPSSVGLPELDSTDGKKEKTEDKNSAEFKQFIKKKVFRNPYIWLLCFANFFVYILRFGIFDWGPTFLKEWREYDLTQGSFVVATFEISGVVGMLIAGWATDRVFKGKAIRMCVFCMLLATVFMFLFWYFDEAPIWIVTIILMAGGFFIYGPQALIGIAASNLATRRAAGTAAGFTGLFGYASVIVTGFGMGYVAQHYGWGPALGILVGSGVIGTLLFLIGWKAKANGYEEE